MYCIVMFLILLDLIGIDLQNGCMINCYNKNSVGKIFPDK